MDQPTPAEELNLMPQQQTRSGSLTKHSPKAQQTTNELISSCVRQCFDIFNAYGKGSEALANIAFGFSKVFQDVPHEHKDIHKAFSIWMQKSSAMPTPKDILDILDKEIIPQKGKKKSSFTSINPNDLQDWQRKVLNHIGEAPFRAWLMDAEFENSSILAANNFKRDFIRDHLLSEIRSVLGASVDVKCNL